MYNMLFWTAIYTFFGLLLFALGEVADRLIRNKKLSRILVIAVSFLLLYLFTILKDLSVGRDTMAYFEGYVYLGSTPWKVYHYGNFDIGYALLAKVFSKVGVSFRLFLCFYYFVVYSLFAISIYFLSNKPNLSVFIFYAVIFWFGLSAQRQVLSAGFIALGMVFLIRPKKVSLLLYILCVFVAVLFHKASILALALIPIKYINLNDKNFAVCLSLFIIIYLLCPMLYRFIVYHFLETNYPPIDGGTGVVSLFYVGLTLLFYLAYSSRRDSTFELPLTIRRGVLFQGRENTSFFFYVALFALTFWAFSRASTNFARIFNYFSFSMVILFPNVAILFCERKKRVVANAAIIGAFTLFMFVTAVYGNGIDIWPYRISILF